MTQDISLRDTTRAREIESEIQARNGIWDAYDQGRWAYAMGYALSDNHHRCPATLTHMNTYDWDRGYKFEEARAVSA